MSLTTSKDTLPTSSHALAAVDEDEILTLDSQAGNLGWNKSPDEMANPIIEGIENDEVWMLLRRFNKLLFHVKAVDNVAGDLDLQFRTDDDFEPDKLCANIERFYMTIVLGFMNVAKHGARLRSWREPRRTATFCIAYFVAWWFELLTPLLLSVIVALIIHPPARSTLFPFVPMALIDVRTGTLQQPRAGKLASGDSITGAAEKYRGEAVEEEAMNFVAGLASIGLSSPTELKKRDRDPKAGPTSPLDSALGSLKKVIPGVSDVGATASEEGNTPAGDASSDKPDEAKVPMQQMMWDEVRPLMHMHVLSEICDTWDRFSNALSPRSPFPTDEPRHKLAGVVVPILLLSIFLDARVFVRGCTFGLGVCFFGRPIICRCLAWLDRQYPEWRQEIELRNTLLRGVPTNAQLTITLLRMGEARNLPLPPPPTIASSYSSETEHIAAEDLPLDVSQVELDAVAYNRPSSAAIDESAHNKSGKKSKLISFARSAAKAGLETLHSTDRFKAVIGGDHARNRLGILSRDTHSPAGPVEFSARYDGKRGRLFVLTSATTPCIAFTPSISPRNDKPFIPLWTVAIDDIVGLTKIGGLGWKAKFVVELAADTHVANALVVSDKLGNSYVLTAMQMRDELFNRLVAMGKQKWEIQ